MSSVKTRRVWLSLSSVTTEYPTLLALCLKGWVEAKFTSKQDQSDVGTGSEVRGVGSLSECTAEALGYCIWFARVYRQFHLDKCRGLTD